MSDNEIEALGESAVAYGGRTHFDMDEAFCARMLRAIAEGLENAPIGIVTTPGTRNPIYVPTVDATRALRNLAHIQM